MREDGQKLEVKLIFQINIFYKIFKLIIYCVSSRENLYLYLRSSCLVLKNAMYFNKNKLKKLR